MSNVNGIHNVRNCHVLMIDAQQRLIPALYDGEHMLQRTALVCQAARTLSVPVTGFEQNPAGLGTLAPEIAPLMDRCLAKQSFSLFSEASCVEYVSSIANQNSRTHLVMMGCEAHVCVMQSALQARAMDYAVSVVWDAVASRNPEDKCLAQQRLVESGCQIVSAEMLIFEWLGHCQHPQFKAILSKLK